MRRSAAAEDLPDRGYAFLEGDSYEERSRPCGVRLGGVASGRLIEGFARQ